MKASFLSAAVSAAALSAAPAAAQPVAPPSNLDARVKALEARVAELERLVAPPSNLPKSAAGCDCNGGECVGLCPGCECKPAAYPLYLVGGRWVPESEFRKAYPAAVAGTGGYGVPSFGSPCANGQCPAPATVYRRR